jgi:hypothetical protein
MPYTPSPELLKRLRVQALNTEEMLDKLDRSECSPEEVEEFIGQREKDIWASAASQISAYNDAVKAATTIEANNNDLSKHRPFVVSLFWHILWTLFGFFVLSLFSLFFQTVRSLVGLAWHRWGPMTIFTLLVVAAVGLAVMRWMGRNKFREYAAAQEDGRKKLEQARAETGRLFNFIEPAVFSNLIGHLRELFDSRSTRPFRVELPDTDTARLSEVPNPQFDVITDSRRNLRTLVEKMNGGSIGVAGPRGSGKTTLLRSFCPEGNVNPKELSIFATAPVQYEPREFLLQLFTFVCSRVITKETRTDPQSPWKEMDSLSELAMPRLLESGMLASVLLLGSMALILGGVLLIAIQASLIVPSVAEKEKSAVSSNAPSPGEKEKEGTPGNAPAGETKPSPTVNVPTAGDKETQGVTATVVSSASPYIVWGMVAFVAGTLLRFGTGQPRPTSIETFFAAPWLMERDRRRKKAEADQASVKDVEPQVKELIEQARRTLRGLRFQQSYSSGWSGALKLPVGLEGGANAAMTIAERQLGLPELVYEYREFVRAAAKHYDRVFIGIDELDKLPSDEDAKKFLNGIKAIFGQDKVYYLVSISENALSNFERRGLPIRDEFDSSFDDAVHLSYFDLSSSRRLLARRSSEPPPSAYRAYCHVASGGLPRDLIRSCRKLYDYRRAHPDAANTIAATCTALISQDVSAKIDAIRYNLQRVPEENSTATVLGLIAIKQWTPEALQEVIYKLHHSQNEIDHKGKNTQNSETSANLLTLANILEELKAYLYFSLAAMVTFQSITDKERFQKLEQTAIFDGLASARQLLAVNRAAAIEAIHALVPLPLIPPAA